MSLIYKIIIAYILDLILGDPYRIPHPITYIGKLIKKVEKLFYPLKNKKFWGIIFNLIVLSVVYTVSFFINKIEILEIYFLYTIFASKSLVKESFKVYKALSEKNLSEARKQLSYLVSRDTESLSENDIIKGTIETCSENITDGIIAPMFYMFIGGLPLAMTYKAINTMDSMVGYKTEKYTNFGWFSARLDDWTNFIPARFGGMIFIPLASLILRYNYKNSLKIYFRDRKNHSSPNSAHTESSVAGAMEIRLGGPTVYFGKVEEKKYIGDEKKSLEISDILKTHKIIYFSGAIALICYSLFFGGINVITWWRYLQNL